MITEYTREAGVRTLERQIGTIARKVAARVATGADSARATVDAPTSSSISGRRASDRRAAFRTSRPGVATGVAWTETGGDVLYIEAVLLPGGGGHLTLTGQLGSVMQESARAALSATSASRPTRSASRAEFLTKQDLHIHVPAGAIPKDGPSAGVTMATAIVSAARGVPVRPDVAMTGEITLSGLVLPVGGIREKALAARRHGIKTFVLPQMNEPDLAELPAGSAQRDDVRAGAHARGRAQGRAAGLGAEEPVSGSRLLHLRPRLRPRLPADRDHQRARRGQPVDAPS